MWLTWYFKVCYWNIWVAIVTIQNIVCYFCTVCIQVFAKHLDSVKFKLTEIVSCDSIPCAQLPSFLRPDLNHTKPNLEGSILALISTFSEWWKEICLALLCAAALCAHKREQCISYVKGSHSQRSHTPHHIDSFHCTPYPAKINLLQDSICCCRLKFK